MNPGSETRNSPVKLSNDWILLNTNRYVTLRLKNNKSFKGSIKSKSMLEEVVFEC
jgi:hypothetical protein